MIDSQEFEVVSVFDIWAHLATLQSMFWKGAKPNEDISIKEHASKNLYLVSGKNPFPGLINLELTPYLIAILDALMPDNGIEKVVLMKGWQTGGTLTALAWMLWVMDISPTSMLIVQPNDELRNRFSKQRIEPITANCRSLRGKIKEMQDNSVAKSKEKSTLITKVFPGGFLNLGTSRAASSLRSDSVQYIVFDEVSAYDEDCQGEGDPCGIALGRTSTFEGRKKIFYISTPKIKGMCRIEEEYDLSDKRRLFFPCFNCGEDQVLEWSRIDISGDDPVYLCIKCQYRHHEEEKPEILKLARWLPTAEPKEKGIIGFHLPALYAPLGMYSWKSALKQYKKGLTNPQEQKVFINNIEGLPWEDRSIKVLDPDDIMSLTEEYYFGPQDILPEGIGLITAGVDTHPSHVDIVVRGWGRDLENWVLDHVVIDGDANSEELWYRVYHILTQTYNHHTGTKLGIATTCIDSGGQNTEAVYEFCRGRLEEMILAIKGAQRRASPVIDKPSLVKEGTCHLFPVGKEVTHGRLFSSINQSLKRVMKMKEMLEEEDKVIPYAGPQVMHFHHELSEKFFKELTGPKAKWAKSGGKWVQVYEGTKEDHAHDAMRYADAAFCFLDLDINRICDERDGVNVA